MGMLRNHTPSSFSAMSVDVSFKNLKNLVLYASGNYSSNDEARYNDTKSPTNHLSFWHSFFETKTDVATTYSLPAGGARISGTCTYQATPSRRKEDEELMSSNFTWKIPNLQGKCHGNEVECPLESRTISRSRITPSRRPNGQNSWINVFGSVRPTYWCYYKTAATLVRRSRANWSQESQKKKIKEI